MVTVTQIVKELGEIEHVFWSEKMVNSNIKQDEYDNKAHLDDQGTINTKYRMMYNHGSH